MGEPTSDGLAEFRRRMHAEWLPAFCDAKKLDQRGFVDESFKKLDPLDASLFMRALDGRLANPEGAFFLAARSRAREQIFWEGRKSKMPRPITLWLEPIITIGMLARLHFEQGWPAESLGAQSEDWAFDFVCYGANESAVVAGEVKKTVKELKAMLTFMGQFAAAPESPEPRRPAEKNAFRKVRALRVLRPSRFCAVGPGRHVQVFGVDIDSKGRFALDPMTEAHLSFARLGPS